MQQTTIIFLELLGAGKRSLSQLYVDCLNYVHISTGNFCRWRYEDESKEGRQIAFFIASGKLILDELMVGAASSWLINHKDSFTTLILDGFPRTATQALDRLFCDDKRFLHFTARVVELNADDAAVEQRLTNWRRYSSNMCDEIYLSSFMLAREGVCGRCCGMCLVLQNNDMSQVAKKRLEMYQQHACSVEQYCDWMGWTPIQIDVDRKVEKVFDQLVCGLRIAEAR